VQRVGGAFHLPFDATTYVAASDVANRMKGHQTCGVYGRLTLTQHAGVELGKLSRIEKSSWHAQCKLNQMTGFGGNFIFQVKRELKLQTSGFQNFHYFTNATSPGGVEKVSLNERVGL